MNQQNHVYISGNVQNVGLRYNFSRQARVLGLIGWIKNLDDRRVEAVVQGEEEKIKEILDWLPKYTKINEIKIIKEKITEKFFEFEIK